VKTGKTLREQAARMPLWTTSWTGNAMPLDTANAASDEAHQMRSMRSVTASLVEAKRGRSLRCMMAGLLRANKKNA
jgi:hypothetical protein